MTIHDLKTWPQPFEAVWVGDKRFEVRVADRPFAVGDRVLLREWLPAAPLPGTNGVYTGREIDARITYLVEPGAWGLPPTMTVFGFSVLWLQRRSADDLRMFAPAPRRA